MAWVVQQFSSDSGIQVGIEDVVRPMPWGTNWTKMRVACRIACNAVATIPYTTFYPVPRVGVCTGSQSWVSPACVDALSFGGVNGGNWSSVLGGAAPNNYLITNGGLVNIGPWQKIGTVLNPFSYTGGYFLWSANPTALRTALFLDVLKTGASTATITLYAPSTAQVIDTSRSAYLLMAESDTPANLSGAAVAVTLVRTAKDWDTAYWGWCRAVPSAVFFDMTLIRFW